MPRKRRQTVATATTEAIPWTEDVTKALAESKKTKKLVLLDFTAAPM